MQKTLLVTIDFPPMFGGVANYWANLCQCLPSNDVVVLAPECFNSLDFDLKQNYLVYRKNLFSKNKWVWPKWLPLFINTYKIVKQEKVKKIIAGHVLPSGTIAYIINKLLGIPYYVSVHGLDLAYATKTKKKKWLATKVFNNAESIIANSQYTKGLLEQYFNVETPVTVVFPCPNFTYKDVCLKEMEQTRKKYGLENKRVILTVGRLVKRKGHDKVIESMQKITNEVTNAVYVVVGQGKELVGLQKRVEEIGLQEKVKFFTDVMDQEMSMFYHLADIFIMPSRKLEDGDIEGFGIVYLEANCFGLPTIAGKSGGAVEAVEHNVNGLLVNPQSINEISKAVVTLLTNSKRAEDLGEKGRARVLKRFNWPEQAKKLSKLLN